MASFLRGKQAGMQKDLSADILPHLFAPDEQIRYGINSQIGCLAYEPVQSLLAVGTNQSKYGNGKIYVFGQGRIQKFIPLPQQASVRFLQFCANRLVSLDSRGELAVWDLDAAKRVAGYLCASGVAALVTDPMLDWALIGYATGEVAAYDLDRERMAPFRLPNFWRQRDPKARIMPTMVSMQMHPRDIGKLLIGYTHGAVIYSFKQNAPTKFFEYQVPPGAPGGNGENIDSMRKPKLVQALWHPTGTFVLTAHEDGSLVFWDPKDGRVVMARSLKDLRVDQPVTHPPPPTVVQPFIKIAWCCKENPDDTALLIAGGQPTDAPEKGLTFLEFGQTPVYATSSWQILSDHFKGKRQHVLQVPPGAGVTDFCPVPRYSPHFAGAQDPIAVLALLTSGEMITLSFPSGYPINPTNQLHPSLSFVHPFVTRFAVSTLDRGRWLGMVEKRNQGEPLLKGGAEAGKPRRRYEGRNIIQVAHGDSTVRLWDLGHGDEMENAAQLQVDVARSVGRFEDVDVTAMHMASVTGEFAAGTRAGEVVVYRWGGNKYFGRDEPKQIASNPGGISDVSSRAEPALKEGLQPFILYEMMQGAVSAVSVSDVGFVAVGSEGGFLSIIDLRGPSVIFQASMADFAEQKKRSSFIRGGSGSAAATKDWPVVIEFGVLTLEGDSYSSICCFVGTNNGKVATFKLLPSGNGYSVKLAGVVGLSDKVVAICPIVASTGQPAAATGPVVAGLRDGLQVHGTLVVVTQTEIRIFKPATAKGASKSFDDVLCDGAAVTEFELHGFALVGVFGDRTTRAFSLPGLKEISKVPLTTILDATRINSAVVATTGDVIGWAGPSELVVIPVWGTGRGLVNTDDVLINPDLTTPPRPTISNLQWISGTQYVSPTDLDLLIGGPDRPPSKRMLDAAAAEARMARAGGGGGAGGSSSSNPRAGTSQEGWGEYLQRQLNERTEKLNLMGDSMDNLEDQSAGWADDVSDFISKQKRNILLGGLKSKFM
ncbi:Snare-dependent exocytosis protein [Pleurostoma richardsiae]|uniref:Snare-dependent exocytosis protein n=1 Tax=Pleurostoma richardsiae TaxID=41990 RepID=A0AA38RUA4_9PEZI|nr:Snare-dependent exocytosis protein [Pleurostoma richardsiae]